MELEKQFNEIVKMIENARYSAMKKVNEELIKLYWNVGKYISDKLQTAEWGDLVVENLADFMVRNYPDIKGFNQRGLYRMKQFYEAYKDDEIVSPLVTQISWTNHLIILSRTKSPEERQFYIKLAIRENYSKRELERQIGSAYFERYMLSSQIVSPVVTQFEDGIENRFLDTYVLDFLNLPDKTSESDLKKAIIQNLKKFILEIGRDFTFIGEEYRLQVGGKDFYIDLLFYHRGLSCLVAFELKIDDFQPEYLGKMNFYLSAVDDRLRHPDDRSSIGIILCKARDRVTVEYALRDAHKPIGVSAYKVTRTLPPKLKEIGRAHV